MNLLGDSLLEEGDGDGENNNGLIRWAKRKMGSIMWRMLPTTTTTTTTNSNKRQKIIGRIVFDDDDLNNNVSNNANNKLLVTLLFSPRLPLTKVMSYLEPCDILNCIQTCKKWKIDMNKDEIWHEVLVANSSFSSRNGALDAIINSNTTTNNNNTQEENENNNDDATTTITTAAAAKSNSISNSNTSNSSINSKLNYRNMAIAMYRKMNDYEEGIPQTFPKSKLNLEDVFVVIEIRDRWFVKQLGSFCSDLTELTLSLIHI